MSDLWGEAVEALTEAKITGVSWGEGASGLPVLELYTDEGMVAIGAIGVRDTEQPFEHGAALTLRFVAGIRQD